MSDWIYRSVVLVVLLVTWTEAFIIAKNNSMFSPFFESSSTTESAITKLPTKVRIIEKAALKELGIKVKSLGNVCECQNAFCQCCFTVDMALFNFSQTMCMKAGFIAEDFALQATMTLNNNTLGSFMVSGSNPPPICVAMPLPPPLPSPLPLFVCLDLKNIYSQNVNLHFCADVIIRFFTLELLKLPLNCMWVGLDGILLSDQR